MSPYQPPRATLRANAPTWSFEASPPPVSFSFRSAHFIIITLHTNKQQREKYQLPPSNPPPPPHPTSWIETDIRTRQHLAHSAAPHARIGRRRVTACLRLSHFRPKWPTKDTTNSNNHTSLYHLQPQIHLAVASPVARAAPAERTSSKAPHNNGFNTSTHLAPRAYTPRSYAWSFARQLRAILPTQIKAHHSTNQPLRIFKL